MKRVLVVFCALLLGCFMAGCQTMKPAPQYEGNDQALLVGKVDCIIPGWFGDKHNKARMELYRLYPDGTKSFISKITSDYSVLAVQPGIYGLSKSNFEVQSGLIYETQSYRTRKDGDYKFLFEQVFWNYTEVEQIEKLHALVNEFFGIIRVKQGDVLYYGDLTLDMVTNRKMPMIVESRNNQAARQALDAFTPGKVNQMKDGYFLGPVFLMGKIRSSRS